MAEPGPQLDPAELRELFAHLDRAGFPATARFPLFTARTWSFQRERRVWQTFRTGRCNVEEAAFPGLFLHRLEPTRRALFRRCCLAEPGTVKLGPPSLESYLGGRPAWRILHRFGRYHLGSPERRMDQPDFVYFGDDTLALMARGRQVALEMSREGAPPEVLDLCCGGGGVGRAVADVSRSVLGLDIHPSSIDLARAVTAAQGLDANCCYRVADVFSGPLPPCDLVLGNPPTLPPELATRQALFAVGPSDRYLQLLERLLCSLSSHGRVLLTHFSVASTPRGTDSIYTALLERLGDSRPIRYRVRRQMPLAAGGWLRHVLLEIGVESGRAQPVFEIQEAQRGVLPGYSVRRLERPSPRSD